MAWVGITISSETANGAAEEASRAKAGCANTERRNRSVRAEYMRIPSTGFAQAVERSSLFKGSTELRMYANHGALKKHEHEIEGIARTEW